MASWLQEVTASFSGPIDVPWTVTADDSDLQRRLDDEVADVADDDLAVHELFKRLRVNGTSSLCTAGMTFCPLSADPVTPAVTYLT